MAFSRENLRILQADAAMPRHGPHIDGRSRHCPEDLHHDE
jgi:hypothetical protein